MRPPVRHHLLHIDDNQHDRARFGYAYKHSGSNGIPHSLGSAMQAIQDLNRLGPFKSAMRPQLIIVDLILPHVDGRQFLEMVRSNIQFKTIAVIDLTGSENFSAMQRCRESFVDDHVIKPKTAQRLIMLITSFKRWLSPADAPSPTPLR